MPREIHNGRCFRIAAPQPEPYGDCGHVEYFGSGREAMMGLVLAFEMNDRTAVLLPAYVPEGLHAPFVRAGCRIVLYPLDENLDPIWRVLEELLLKHRPFLAVIIHYYGLPKPSRRFADLCHRYQTFVVEDLAHVLPGRDCPLGHDGDFVLYSPNKVVGVPDGGILVFRSDAPAFSQFHFQRDWRRILYLIQQMGILLVSTASRLLPSGRWLTALRLGTGMFLNSYTTLMSYFMHPHCISWVSRWLLKHCDWEGWASERLAHARRYADMLDPVVFRRFQGTFQAGAGPFGYPVLVFDRASLIQYLALRGIRGTVLTARWDFIPEDIRVQHSGAVSVLERHFLFPNSQGLSVEEIETVISVANEWAKFQPSERAAEETKLVGSA